MKNDKQLFSIKTNNKMILKIVAISFLLIVSSIALVAYSKRNTTDWMRFYEIDVTGFNGYGYLTVGTKTMDTIDDKSFFVKKMEKRYWRYIKQIYTLANYYKDDFARCEEIDYIYDISSILELGEELSQLPIDINEQKLIESTSFDQAKDRIAEFNEVLCYPAIDGSVKLPQGIDNGNLSNGDTIRIECRPTGLLAVLGYRGQTSKEIIVSNLEPSITLNVSDLITLDYEIVRDYQYPHINFHPVLDESKLPNCVALSDIDVKFNNMFDKYTLTLASKRDGLFLIDNTSDNPASDTVKLTSTHENGTWFLYESFNLDVESIENYDHIASIVYEQVDKCFEEIDFTIIDENKQPQRIKSYVLRDYFYYDWGNSVGLNVTLENDKTYHVLINGTLVNFLGNDEFILDPNFHLTGEIDSFGGIR